jgi:hypothetical protein
MGLPSNLVPDHLDTGLNFAISNYLKKLVQQVSLGPLNDIPDAVDLGKT